MPPFHIWNPESIKGKRKRVMTVGWRRWTLLTKLTELLTELTELKV
jgi:hypothetical protein